MVWGCSSIVDYLPNMHEVYGLILSNPQNYD